MRAVVGALGLCLGLGGCGSDGPPPGGDARESLRQLSYVHESAQGWPELVLFVVEDADTDEARALRAAVGDATSAWEADRRATTGTCDPWNDPAHWDPIERRTVVVRPSAPPGQRLWSWLDDPKLAWVADDRTPEGDARWSGAVRQALEDRLAPADAPYPLLEAATDTLALLAGRRDPADAHEAALVAALSAVPEGPRPLRVQVVLATTRDDAGAAPVASYPAPLDGPWFPEWLVVAPTDEDCASLTSLLRSPSVEATPRLAAWVEPTGASLGAVRWWPCDALSLVVGASDGGCPGGTHPIARWPDGTAQCRVEATLAGTEPCDGALGHLDPLGEDGLRRPLTVVGSLGEDAVSRRCEVRQLTGAALASCVHSVDCPDCEPGWCWSERWPELIPPGQGTRAGKAYVGLRYVLGADLGFGFYDVTCNLAEP
jgi:hypothetical protein